MHRPAVIHDSAAPYGSTGAGGARMRLGIFCLSPDPSAAELRVAFSTRGKFKRQFLALFDR